MYNYISFCIYIYIYIYKFLAALIDNCFWVTSRQRAPHNDIKSDNEIDYLPPSYTSVGGSSVSYTTFAFAWDSLTSLSVANRNWYRHEAYINWFLSTSYKTCTPEARGGKTQVTEIFIVSPEFHLRGGSFPPEKLCTPMNFLLEESEKRYEKE